MTIKTRLALAGASVLLLAAWHYPTSLQPPAVVPTSYAYTFKDARPKKWFDSGTEGGGSQTNCAYGIMRIGQDDIDQPLPNYLHAMLAERFGDRLAGKSVTLRFFSLHMNKAVEIRRGGIPGLGGVLGSVAGAIADIPGALHAKEVGCSPADAFGGYTPGEVDSESPVIVAIDIYLDGHRYLGRAIAPSPGRAPPMKRAPQAEKDAWNATVQALVAKAAANLGDQIEHDLAAAPVAQPAETPPATTGAAPK